MVYNDRYAELFFFTLSSSLLAIVYQSLRLSREDAVGLIWAFHFIFCRKTDQNTMKSLMIVYDDLYSFFFIDYQFLFAHWELHQKLSMCRKYAAEQICAFHCPFWDMNGITVKQQSLTLIELPDCFSPWTSVQICSLSAPFQVSCTCKGLLEGIWAQWVMIVSFSLRS